MSWESARAPARVGEAAARAHHGDATSACGINEDVVRFELLGVAPPAKRRGEYAANASEPNEMSSTRAAPKGRAGAVPEKIRDTSRREKHRREPVLRRGRPPRLTMRATRGEKKERDRTGLTLRGNAEAGS